MFVIAHFAVAGRRPRADDQISFHQLVKSRLESLPGEHAASVAAEKRPALAAIIIGPDYFRTMGVKPIRGRVFDERDGAPGMQAGIVTSGSRRSTFRGRADRPWR